MSKYFCEVYECAGKADLSKGYWNTNTKLGVTAHFSEIIKQQYFYKVPEYEAMYGNFS